MELIKIAWRNIWRSKTRSMVVILAVTFGMLGGGFSTAVMLGAVDRRVDKAINNESAHFQVHQDGYLENPEPGLFMTDVQAMINEFKQKDFVSGVSNRLLVNAMMQSPHNTSGATVNGINPAQEKQVSSLHENLVEGTYFEADKNNQVVISKSTAEKLKLNVRSKMVLTFQDKEGNLTGGAFRVAGIFNTSNKAFDEMNVFVLRKDLESLTGFSENQTHEIAVLFEDNDDLKERTAGLKDITPERLDARNWKELNPELGMMSMMTEKYLSYLVAIILFALAFGIINTMLMAILERKKELAMLKAIGMNEGKIRIMIVWETLFLTAIGSLAGLAINQALVMWLGKAGINLAAFSEGMESFGFGSVIYPSINGTFYLQIVALVILTALVASIFPIIRASKMKPAEILSSN
ncbi:MAG: FtsX-like permease family protein [Candidatus Delongbacteria bacterium]|jgi:putative ABC transport system permease protein|nr:FtsX-like permease family protein [Candidatus Delongbacteria bacterium]